MSEPIYHIPALLPQTIAALDIKPGGVYADATFGGGGHSRAVLGSLSAEGRLFGFDRDSDAAANAPEDPRFTFVLSNFRYMENFMRYYGIERFDGIVADLGVSFHHFDDAARGFSFRSDAPLDMRMTRRAPLTAAEIVNTFDQTRLTTIFRTFTDLKNASQIVRAIINAREKALLETTFDLCRAVEPLMNPRKVKKDMAQVFQALRIETNGEMDALCAFLSSAPRLLRPGGRLAVLTYHSVEDRIVKNFMKSGNIGGEEQKDFFGNVISPWRLVGRNPVTPDQEEILANPRSRSAKLRVAELKGKQ